MPSAMSSLGVPPFGATLIDQKQQSPPYQSEVINLFMEGTSLWDKRVNMSNVLSGDPKVSLSPKYVR